MRAPRWGGKWSNGGTWSIPIRGRRTSQQRHLRSSVTAEVVMERDQINTAAPSRKAVSDYFTSSRILRFSTRSYMSQKRFFSPDDCHAHHVCPVVIQKACDVHPMSGECWATVYDGCPTSIRHWVNVTCLRDVLVPITHSYNCLSVSFAMRSW